MVQRSRRVQCSGVEAFSRKGHCIVMRIIDQGVLFDATGQLAHRRTNCFTSLFVMPGDRILVSFRTGKTKDDPDENLILRLSQDGGKSWETVFEGLPPRVDGIGGGWRHGPISLLEPGRLIGSFCWFDRSERNCPLANPETQGVLPSRVFVMESRDEGRTWVDRREVNTKPFEGIATTGAILKLANGALALPYEAWKSYSDTSYGKHHAILRISHDGGHSFDPAVIVAHDPNANLFFWDQRLALDPETGRIVGLFWTHERQAQQDRNIHIAWGSPDGKTWTQPVDTGMAGQIASPLILPGGRVLAVYVHRHSPPSLRAVLSEDFGKTWDRANELVFYASGAGKESGMEGQRSFGDYWSDMSVWNFGHPEAALLANGDIFIAFYGGDSNALSMRWVRMTLST